MIKEYDNGVLIGFFHKGRFVPDPGTLILEIRLSQEEHRRAIDWLEQRVRLLVEIQKWMNKNKEATD